MLHKTLLIMAFVACASSALGATISVGDVTTNLAGDLFFDDARTGGGDQTINDVNGAGVPLAPVNIQRYFDFDVVYETAPMDRPWHRDGQGLRFRDQRRRARERRH